MTWPAEPFWDYSVALYRKPGVEAACLDLQRRHGLDVTMLLYACWLASCGVTLDRMLLARAEKAVKSWRIEVVQPLRALRQRLRVKLQRQKPDGIHTLWSEETERLRAAIAALELDSEHLAHLALGRIAASAPPRASDASGVSLAIANVRMCWSFTRADDEALRTLIMAAFPGAEVVIFSPAAD